MHDSLTCSAHYDVWCPVPGFEVFKKVLERSLCNHDGECFIRMKSFMLVSLGSKSMMVKDLIK